MAHSRGRDAETGRFITVEEARRRKKTAIVEKVDEKPPETKVDETPSKPKKKSAKAKKK